MAFTNYFSDVLDSSRNLPPISEGDVLLEEHALGQVATCCWQALEGLGKRLRWLSHVSPNPEGHESLPNGSSQSSCQVPFPRPKITTTNNVSTIKKFKSILNHLIINHVQLVSGVFCAAVWSPWRLQQHHSNELMSSGCVLSTRSAASPCSASGLMLPGRTPTSEDFLPFPAGS